MAWFNGNKIANIENGAAPTFGENVLDVAPMMPEDNGIVAWKRRGDRDHKPGIASADAAAQFKAVEGTTAYDIVLSKIKEDLQLSRSLPPDAYTNPQQAHFDQALDLARRAIDNYNGGAATRGYPMLCEADEPKTLRRATKLLRLAPSASPNAWSTTFSAGACLQPFMTDTAVEEIYINGAGLVFVQRAGEKPVRVNAIFQNPQSLLTFINNKLDSGTAARTVTLKTPYRDFRLRDGSRIHVIMDPLVSNLGQQGMAVTIRRFRPVARTIDDLIRLQTINSQAANFLTRLRQRQSECLHLGRHRLGQDHVSDRADQRDRPGRPHGYCRRHARTAAWTSAKLGAADHAREGRGRRCGVDGTARPALSAHAPAPHSAGRGAWR